MPRKNLRQNRLSYLSDRWEDRAIESKDKSQKNRINNQWIKYFYYTCLFFLFIAFSVSLVVIIARFIRSEKAEVKFDRDTIKNLISFEDMPNDMEPSLRETAQDRLVDAIVNITTPKHPDTYIVLKSALDDKLKIKIFPRLKSIFPFDDVPNSGMFWIFNNTIGLKIYEVKPKEFIALPGYPTINDVFNKLIEHEFHHAAVAMTNSDERCDPSAITNLQAIIAGIERTPALPRQSEKIATIYAESSRLILNKLKGLINKREQNKLNNEGIELLNNLSEALKDYQPYLIVYSIMKQAHAVKAKETLARGEIYKLTQLGLPPHYVHAYYDFGDQLLLLAHLTPNVHDKLNALIHDVNYFTNHVAKANRNRRYANSNDIGQMELDAYTSYNTDRVVRTLFFRDVHAIHVENMKQSKCAIAREAAQFAIDNEKDISDAQLADYYSHLRKYKIN